MRIVIAAIDNKIPRPRTVDNCLPLSRTFPQSMTSWHKSLHGHRAVAHGQDSILRSTLVASVDSIPFSYARVFFKFLIKHQITGLIRV